MPPQPPLDPSSQAQRPVLDSVIHSIILKHEPMLHFDNIPHVWSLLALLDDFVSGEGFRTVEAVSAPNI